MKFSCRSCPTTIELTHFTNPVKPLNERGWFVTDVKVDRSRQRISIVCLCPKCFKDVRRTGMNYGNSCRTS